MALADLDGDGLLDIAALGRGASINTYLAREQLEVAIDMAPHRTPNFVLPDQALSVALLGSPQFSVEDVDATTLAFGPGHATPLGMSSGHPLDVDQDGVLDLVSLFLGWNTGIDASDSVACLRGETTSGTRFRGCDSVLVPRSCGLGFELAFVLAPILWLWRRLRR